MRKFLDGIYKDAIHRVSTWIWSGWANDLSVVLFVLSAFISCGKSLLELFYPCCGDAQPCVSTGVNIVILVFFVVSMGLVFLIDSTQNPSFPKRGKGRF